MTAQWLGVIIVVVINTIILAVAWGDMRRQVTGNRERQDERHEENKAQNDKAQVVMHEVRDDVRRINGTIVKHGTVLEVHSKEIDRLRGA